jgi:hypothetical protein
LDSFGGFQPFQWVALTPRAKNSFPASSPRLAFADEERLIRRSSQDTTTSDFCKDKVPIVVRGLLFMIPADRPCRVATATLERLGKAFLTDAGWAGFFKQTKQFR